LIDDLAIFRDELILLQDRVATRAKILISTCLRATYARRENQRCE
jgi:hypothetical protein